MRKTVDVLGVAVDHITMDEALGRVRQWMLGDGPLHPVYTPNAEILYDAAHNQELCWLLNAGDLVVPDGAGVVLGARLLGTPLPQKLPGFDLALRTMKMDLGRPMSVYLLGGKPGVAETAARNLILDFPKIQIAGFRDGYFKPDDVPGIIADINGTRPDLLLVALGAPRQEFFIHNHRQNLSARVAMGVGGTLDVLAGTVELAPDFFRNHGLEWLYRLYREPWRWRRMTKLPRFVLRVLRKRVFGR